ncbi:MAG TPA: hypothetical protein VGG75_05425 [Trebonia sp.]
MMFRIQPRPRDTIEGTASWDSRNGARTIIANIAAYRLARTSRAGRPTTGCRDGRNS